MCSFQSNPLSPTPIPPKTFMLNFYDKCRVAEAITKDIETTHMNGLIIFQLQFNLIFSLVLPDYWGAQSI